MRDRYLPNFINLEETKLNALDIETGSLAKKFCSNVLSVIEKLTKTIFEHVKPSDPDRSVYTGTAGIALMIIRLGSLGIDSSSSSFLKEFQHISNYSSKSDVFLTGNPFANHPSSCSTEKESDELLYGRAGCLYSFKHFKGRASEGAIKHTVDEIISHGKSKGDCMGWPLMWKWHSTSYIGAAHGLAGILAMLFVHHQYLDGSQLSPVKETLLKLLDEPPKCRLSIEDYEHAKAPSGNWKSSLESTKDELVQWCHGAPGIAISIAVILKHAKDKFNGQEQQILLNNLEKAADITWERGILKKGVGLCHGLGGNGYVFLHAYLVTKKQDYLVKAAAFAEIIMSWAKDPTGYSVPDRPYSLYEGMAGAVCFLADLANINSVHIGFPGFADI